MGASAQFLKGLIQELHDRARVERISAAEAVLKQELEQHLDVGSSNGALLLIGPDNKVSIMGYGPSAVDVWQHELIETKSLMSSRTYANYEWKWVTRKKNALTSLRLVFVEQGLAMAHKQSVEAFKSEQAAKSNAPVSLPGGQSRERTANDRILRSDGPRARLDPDPDGMTLVTRPKR